MSTHGAPAEFSKLQFFKALLEIAPDNEASETLLLGLLPDHVLENATEHLSFEELLKMACSKPAFSEKLMSLVNLDKENAQKSFEERYMLYKNNPFLKRLDRDCLKMLAQACLPFAELIFKDEAFRKFMPLQDGELFELGQVHLPIAQRFIQTGILYKDSKLENDRKLKNDELMLLAQSHSSIAQELLHRGYLSEADKARLTILHRFATDEFIKSNHLLHSLYTGQLVELGEKDLSIAQMILEDVNLTNKLYGQQLADIGHAHASIAEKIMNDNDLFAAVGASLPYMVAPHFSLAQRLLSDERLLNLTFSEDEGWGLVQCGQNHLALARKILADDRLRAMVEDICPNYLEVFTHVHPVLAKEYDMPPSLEVDLPAPVLRFRNTMMRLAGESIEEKTARRAPSM